MNTSTITLTDDEMIAVCKSLSIGCDQLAKKLINMRGSSKQLNRLNKKKSKKYRKGKKQSRNYHKARKRYARKHLRVSRQRKDFVKSVALRLVKSNDLIAYLALSTSVRLLIRTNHTRTLYL